MDKMTAIITGSGRGIGAECAIAFAKEGYNVVVNYTSREPLELIEKLDSMGASFVAVKGDVSVEEDAKAIVKKAIEAFGTVSVLVNNAGIAKDGLLLRMKTEDFRKVLDVNLTGTFNMIREVSGTMVKKRYGRIINISSVVGIMGNAGQANYASSKAGVIGLTKSVARELARRGITCNAVAPGYVSTDMTGVLTDDQKAAISESIPLKELGKTEDIANAVLFLAKPESSYITGQVLAVDGGMSM
ncbi:3-oxoacyl-[acyl-carrier-protein] reductase [Youngiibacter multivorans]|uniref:3-oxoacyl-[acyl-carrier-protein] reductase n=1 Tax=Youngiibacter multivorans TaxID=937251 RepID=A0ABS4G2Q0_9CLOT|nr:3-oxoacyl-[acyl-carrier-protein] reductase [Youngiibacter multivorans]MBP1918818.1 3-oxoacyl-[acyl-carrier protein] reductase [Youngiibacter multivorans]